MKEHGNYVYIAKVIVALLNSAVGLQNLTLSVYPLFQLHCDSCSLVFFVVSILNIQWSSSMYLYGQVNVDTAAQLQPDADGWSSPINFTFTFYGITRNNLTVRVANIVFELFYIQSRLSRYYFQWQTALECQLNSLGLNCG